MNVEADDGEVREMGQEPLAEIASNSCDDDGGPAIRHYCLGGVGGAAGPGAGRRGGNAFSRRGSAPVEKY